MADNQIISNSYLSNNPDIRPRAIEKTTAPAVVATLTQIVGIDIGGTGAESLVTSLNPLPISGSFSLPVGASTEAKQDTGNTSLATIAAKDFATQTTLASLLTELQLKADLSETQPVSLAGFTTLTEGEKNISAAATPEAIGSGAIKKIIITAKEANTGTIWVKSTVTNNTLGRPLLPLQAETLEISNLNLIFLKATVNGEGVTFLAFS